MGIHSAVCVWAIMAPESVMYEHLARGYLAPMPIPTPGAPLVAVPIGTFIIIGYINVPYNDHTQSLHY
jgi:hypothetical protein